MNYQKYIKENFYSKSIFKGDPASFIGIHCIAPTWDEEDASIFLTSEKGLEYGLKQGIVSILDTPVTNKNNFSYKLQWNLPKEDSYINVEQLYEGLKSKKIKLILNGYWNNNEKIREYVLSDLENFITEEKSRLQENLSEVSQEIVDLYEKGDMDDLYVKVKEERLADNSEKRPIASLYFSRANLTKNLYDGPFSNINLGFGSSNLTLSLPTRKFEKFGNGIPIHFGKNINEIQLDTVRTDMYKRYCEPNIAEIKIENSITFANFFLSVHDLFPSNQYDLGYFDGEQRLMDLYASENIAYGCGGNSSFHVWENDNEFVITSCGDSCSDEDNYLYCLKKYGPNNPETLECKNAYEWFQNLKATHKLLNKNSLDMSMWRWEAMETVKVTEEDRKRFDYGKDYNMLTVPYSGHLFIEDHYRKRTQVPDYVFAIMKKVSKSI